MLCLWWYFSNCLQVLFVIFIPDRILWRRVWEWDGLGERINVALNSFTAYIRQLSLVLLIHFWTNMWSNFIYICLILAPVLLEFIFFFIWISYTNMNFVINFSFFWKTVRVRDCVLILARYIILCMKQYEVQHFAEDMFRLQVKYKNILL